MNLGKKSLEPIECIIVDDDPFMQDLLRDKLAIFPNIFVLDVASSALEAIEMIERHQPELVFLDVEMPDLTGFEMLERIEKIGFKTIFVTSYSHYAIKAIRFNALDYILKPIDLQELRQAISRFQEQRDQPDREKIKRALNNNNISPANRILTLNVQQGQTHIPLVEVLYVEGERNYSFIHTVDQKKTLVSKTLSAVEELVEDAGFFRCHKSYLVNRRHLVGKMHRSSVELTSGTKIPISRRKAKMFKEWLST